MNFPAVLLSLFVILPILGCITILVFGRALGNMGCSLIAILILNFLLFNSIFCCSNLVMHDITQLTVGNWLNIYIQLDWILLADALSLEMCFVISLITLCVIIYSVGYMGNDPHLSRFVGYLMLFASSMFILVTSGNLIQLFIGWEGVGLASFLLISFWFTRLEAVRSSLKAIFFNRIGDMGFIAGVSVLAIELRTVNVYDILTIASGINISEQILGTFEVAALLLFFGAMAKSAQIGLHAWLADAMEGPTPVSALLHSATMVTAGIFLLLRLSPIFLFSSRVLIFIALIGSLTALLGATIAIFQYDIKKIIAYSTCSQLGFMITAFGILNLNGCFFHLVNHAFFKALLFLTAGSTIHALHNEQDLRKMGGLVKLMPITYFATLVGLLSLAGFPFLSGFFSKEFVILFSLYGCSQIELFVFFCILFSSIGTALYCGRYLYLLYFARYRGPAIYLNSIHEPSLFMLIPIFILIILSIIFGYLYDDLFIGAANPIWNSVFNIWVSYDGLRLLVQEEAPLLFKLFLSFMFVLAILFAASYSYRKHQSYLRRLIGDEDMNLPELLRKRTKPVVIGNETMEELVIMEKEAKEIADENWNKAKVYPIYGRTRIRLLFYRFFTEKWFFSAIYRTTFNKLMGLAYYVSIKQVDRGVLERIQTQIILNIFHITNIFKQLVPNFALFTNLILYVIGLVMLINIEFFPYEESIILLYLILCNSFYSQELLEDDHRIDDIKFIRLNTLDKINRKLWYKFVNNMRGIEYIREGYGGLYLLFTLIIIWANIIIPNYVTVFLFLANCLHI